MATPLYHVGAPAICPHGGQITTTSTNTRVKVSQMMVATSADMSMVAGCTFSIPPTPKPQPCVKVQWIVPALRVKVMGNPVLLQNSTGLCQSGEQIPQGPPNVISTQPRVKGT
jgi:hypothetical protein